MSTAAIPRSMVSADSLRGCAPLVHASAPGRVNLLGEHADCNVDCTLLIATPQRTEVALAPSRDGEFQCDSANLDASCRFSAGDSTPPGFARSIEGCIHMVEATGTAVGRKPACARGRTRRIGSTLWRTDERSHASRRDYAVSIAARDVLTVQLRAPEDVAGARLTGAGFGGACVALCQSGMARAAARAALRQYSSGGMQASIMLPAPPREEEDDE